MNPHSFSIIFRHLWRNRLFTFLNILGLAIGISACWVVFTIVSFEFSFDQKIPSAGEIYRVISKFKSPEGSEGANAGVPKPLASAIRDQVPEITLAVPIQGYFTQPVSVVNRPGQQSSLPDAERIVNTENEYFELIQYQWLAGDKRTSLSTPEAVVLTQSRAERYFPKEKFSDILGKTIHYNDTISKTVTGVVADLDYPSSFPAKEFFRIDPKFHIASAGAWGSLGSNDALYVKFSPKASIPNTLKKINQISTEPIKAEMAKYKYKRWQDILPLSEVHFATNLGEGIAKRILYSLLGVAGFLLWLACINYINLSTAEIPQRAREIGIRKTLGSSKRSLVFRFLRETSIIVAGALLLSFFLARGALAYFHDLMPEGSADYSNYWALLGFLGLMLLGVVLISGFLPSFMMARLQPVRIIGKQSPELPGKGRLGLRKSLIVFQFVIAQFFIIVAIAVGRQLTFMTSSDMGFQSKNMALVQMNGRLKQDPAFRAKKSTLLQEIRNLPGVTSASAGLAPLDDSYFGNVFTYTPKGKEPVNIQLAMKFVDSAYLSSYKIPLLAGRNITPSDTIKELLVNQAFLKKLGFTSPEEAVGKSLKNFSGKLIPIVGVIKDFHSQNFYSSIEPLAFASNEGNESFEYLNIQLAAGFPTQNTLAAAKKIWSGVFPKENFDPKFYEDKIEAINSGDRNMQKIINLATGVAVLLSCLGLFGLSTLTVFQKTKEIGIRKVMGATLPDIVLRLSRNFLVLVAVAVIIASPLAWYVLTQWLQAFAYRIEIGWLIYPLSGLAALAIALITLSYQSVKAALADPVKSLRSE